MVAALLATGSAAAEDAIVHAPMTEAVTFAGREVAYEEKLYRVRATETEVWWSRVMRRAPGGRPRVVATLPRQFSDPGRGSLHARIDWDVSPSRFLYGARFETYPPDTGEGAEVRGGAPGAPLFRFARCAGGSEYARPSVAVWHDVGAYYHDGCSTLRRRVVVRRLDDPMAPPWVVLRGTGGTVDLAGRYLAVNHARWITVFDRRSRARVYSVSARFYGDRERRAIFELQADGKLAAVLLRADDTCEAAWFSRSEPRAHIVGQAACDRDVGLRADRIAWVRHHGDEAELVVKPLDGVERSIARFPIHGPDFENLTNSSTVSRDFAFDGRRLAYSVARCDGRRTLLLRRTIDGPTFRDSDPLTCPFTVTNRSLTVGRRAGAVSVPLHCPRGCSGFMRIQRDDSVTQGFAVRPGRGRVRLNLDDAIRRRLLDRSRADVTVWFEGRHRLVGSSIDVVTLRLRRR